MSWLRSVTFLRLEAQTSTMKCLHGSLSERPVKASVGARGFEPRTSRSRSVRAAELRYAP